jgi:hypothetical protein
MYGYATSFTGSGSCLHISVNTLPGLQAIAIALELSAANLLRSSCDCTYEQWYTVVYSMSVVSIEAQCQ